MSHVLRIFARLPALKSSSRLVITQTDQVVRIHNIKLAQLHDTLYATKGTPPQLHGFKFHTGAVSKEIQPNQAACEIEFREVHGRVRDATPSPLMQLSNKRKEPSQVVVGSVIAAAALGTKARATLAGVELAAKRNLNAADTDCAFDF